MGELAIAEPAQEIVTRPKMGRPTLYTEEKARELCDLLERGMTKRSACALVGVNEETFRLWADTRDDFIQLLACAEAKAEQAFTKAMYEAATDSEFKADWRPAVEWLKRRRRADYGDTLDVRRIDSAQLLALLQAQSTEDDAITEDGEPARLTAQDVI